MTDLRKAAEMALDALESCEFDYDWEERPYKTFDEDLVNDAVDALRKALDHVPDTMKMLEPDMGIDRGAWDDVPDATKWVDELRGGDETEQEPVAYLYHDTACAELANPLAGSTLLVLACDRKPNGRNETPLYTAPPSKSEQDPVAWTKVSDKLPKSGVIVLACYKNRLSKLRCIRAHWVAAKTVETSVDYGECFEYDEETDEYYLPEGWYECMDNWDEYSSVAVCEGEVTHWMPLPPAPDEAHTAPPSKP